MAFKDEAGKRAQSVRDDVRFPRRQRYRSSPSSWADEVIYFLLVDRFSDGLEAQRPLLDRSNVAAARPPLPGDGGWRWDRWWPSGRDRWQGGTLKGVTSKLDYLHGLGVTAVWLSPVFKQRGHLDTYHGYGIQDFLDVDPRFGTRQDLVELVEKAHQAGLRVILDVIFNHSGSNWVYPGGDRKRPFIAGSYPFGSWLDEQGAETGTITGPGDGVWPKELQHPDAYTRAGSANLAEGTDIGEPLAEHKRGDFEDLRDFNLARPGVLGDLARCFKYWIALTGCDGFRIDTVKHVSMEDARNFCGSIKEFAVRLGVDDFLLIGEIAGGDSNARRYLDVLGRNMNAALDIGESRPTLTDVAKGLARPRAYLDGFKPTQAELGSHRVLGDRHVSILDDHDHVAGRKVRFSADAASDHQVVAGVAIQLLTLGIPCIYYGTEQALGAPEVSERQFLEGFGSHDEYLREAMFGPEHPRAAGLAGVQGSVDTGLRGFGPFGTSGAHVFDPRSPAYVRIATLAAGRRDHFVLRHGRQYEREIRTDGAFRLAEGGELIAWSRILDDEEALCVVNGHGGRANSADVTVDAALNPVGTPFTVVINTAEAGGAQPAGPHPVGSTVTVAAGDLARVFLPLRDLGPSEALVLINHPAADPGEVRPGG